MSAPSTKRFRSPVLLKETVQQAKDVTAAKHQIKDLEQCIASLKHANDDAKPANLKTGMVDALNNLVMRYFY